MAMIISWILFFLTLERTIGEWKLLLSLILTVLFYRYESRIQDPFVHVQSLRHFFVPPEETGTASGLFMSSRYIGTILSSSPLGILFGKNITAGGLHMMALVSSVLGSVILLFTLRMPPNRGRPATSGNH